MSGVPRPAGVGPEEPDGPERPDQPERVFRETFLCRFDEEAAAHLERCGETLLTLAEVGGFLPSGATSGADFGSRPRSSPSPTTSSIWSTT